jgi:hypothetical protein
MASVFEELRPYAGMTVVPGVTVGQLNYVNQQDLLSTGCITTSTAGVVAANTRLPLFNAALFEPAASQGFTAGNMSTGQTNSKFSKGQAPANQVFIATHCAFGLFKRSNADLTDATAFEDLTGMVATPTAGVFAYLNDTYALAQNLSWDLTIGRGITRTIGTLAEYCSPSVYAKSAQAATVISDAVLPGTGANLNVNKGLLGSPTCGMKKLEVPIIFPPLVNVNIEVRSGSPFQTIPLFSATGPAPAVALAQNILVRQTLRGYLMTMPVG